MMVITDAPEYAGSLLVSDPAIEFEAPERTPAAAPRPGSADAAAHLLGPALLDGAISMRSDASTAGLWRYLVVTRFARGSQYKRLIDLTRRRTPVPDGTACIARSGSGFQGFRGRGWVAAPGNIHLSVHLAPGCEIERFETVFMALAAVSVVDTIDELPGFSGVAGIKWVNDIVIGEAKVAGVLAHTQTRGSRVTAAILGIGLNVETTPTVAATPFVPSARSLRDWSPEPAAITAPDVLRRLLRNLARNYGVLLREGYPRLMERYRERSVVVGREVLISADEPDEVPRVFAEGRVVDITDGMELRLVGTDRLVNRGRLILPSSVLLSAPAPAPPYRQFDIAS